MFRPSLALLPVLLLLPAMPTLAADKVDPKLQAEFSKSDTNKDGALSQAEVAARIKRMDVGATKMSPARVKLLSEAWFKTADANHDAKVTSAEMQGLLRAIASRYDTNHDGVVSIAERQAARAGVAAGPPVGR